MRCGLALCVGRFHPNRFRTRKVYYSHDHAQTAAYISASFAPSARARCRRSPTLPSVACGAALPAAAFAPLVQLLAQQEEGSRSVE